MAISYTGAPEDVQAFGDKFHGHVSVMSGHITALDNVKDQFRGAVNNSATGTAIQTSFNNAISKGQQLRDFLQQAADVMKANGAAMDNIAQEGAGQIAKGDYNF
ncbi:hypothetical protein [Nocardia cyriacigeorgica]|uniref:hypothetical protein n=1 Tax=Nocardia cyriacigeorgica TaxID=135487 RepID=UPI0024573F53|nr:hypothetical protein [Nocardia cyriacigeorgica]